MNADTERDEVVYTADQWWSTTQQLLLLEGVGFIVAVHALADDEATMARHAAIGFVCHLTALVAQRRVQGVPAEVTVSDLSRTSLLARSLRWVV